MISFNIHVPSVVLGFLIGYIVVSIAWIVFSFNDNWSTGFGEGYSACRESFKRKSEQIKNDETSIKTKK